MIFVGVDTDHPICDCRLQWHAYDRRAAPCSGDVPATPSYILVDAVGDSLVRLNPVVPLKSAIRERHPRAEHVSAVPSVGQTGQRRWQLQADFAIWRDADRVVTESFTGLAIGLQKPTRGLPSTSPLRFGEPRSIEIMPSGQ